MSTFILKTSRTLEGSAELFSQVLSSLPPLKNSLINSILGTTEHCSFEVVVYHQTLYVMCHVPERIAGYVQQMLLSQYPEMVIENLDHDPVADIAAIALNHPELAQVAVASTRSAELPLHTTREFSVDPLTSVYSLLAALSPEEMVVIQIALDTHKRVRKVPTRGGSVDTSSENSTASTSSSPLKNAPTYSLSISIGVCVVTASHDRSIQLIENIGNSYQVFSRSDGASLSFRTRWLPLFKSWALRAIGTRAHQPFARFDLSIPEIASLIHPPDKDFANVPNLTWGKQLLGEPPENLPVVNSMSDSDAKRDINTFARTTFKSQSVVYGLHRPDRRRHMYVIGKTGTGKSTLLANMAINDLKNDEGMCVIDPHGDLVETLLDYIPSRRINDVVYFDPSDPERTVKINLFEGNNVVHRELIASGIVSVFKKLYGYSWGPRLEYILRNSLLTLLKSDEARLSDITDLLTDTKFRSAIVSKLDDPILKNFWVNEFDAMQDRLRTEAVAPVLNKVGQFVSSPLVRDVVNARKSSFNIEDAMNEGKIILVNLSQGKLGEDNATLLGAMLITKIQLSAMARVNTPEESRRDFYLYVDEFQNFATESFAKILSEARKYRLNLVLANQYTAQIPEDVQKAIFGNCGSIAAFVMGADDAQIFSHEFSDVYSPQDLVSLDKHQIINRLSIDNVISKAFPAFTLPLAASSNQNRSKVVNSSRERYARKK